MKFFLFLLLIAFIIGSVIRKSKSGKKSFSYRSPSTYRSRYVPKTTTKVGMEGEQRVSQSLAINSSNSYGNAYGSRQINNLILIDANGNSHQIDHVEIRRNGIFCIETKTFTGLIKGKAHEKEWIQYVGHNRYTHYNPLLQNQTHVKVLRSVLGNRYPVHSLVVMANNNAVHLGIPNVINLSHLVPYLSDFNDGTQYTPQEIDTIYQILQRARAWISTAEHVQNVRRRQTAVQNFTQSPAVTSQPNNALSRCPRCNNALIIKTDATGTYQCCQRYPQCEYTNHAFSSHVSNNIT